MKFKILNLFTNASLVEGNTIYLTMSNACVLVYCTQTVLIEELYVSLVVVDRK